MLSGLQHRILVRLPADRVLFLISSDVLKQISVFECTIIPCLEDPSCLVWIEIPKCFRNLCPRKSQPDCAQKINYTFESNLGEEDSER